jgi:hypothetical protein
VRRRIPGALARLSLGSSLSRCRRFRGQPTVDFREQFIFARLRSRITYANVIASLALFMAMGGTG